MRQNVNKVINFKGTVVLHQWAVETLLKVNYCSEFGKAVVPFIKAKCSEERLMLET